MRELETCYDLPVICVNCGAVQIAKVPKRNIWQSYVPSFEIGPFSVGEEMGGIDMLGSDQKVAAVESGYFPHQEDPDNDEPLVVVTCTHCENPTLRKLIINKDGLNE